MSDGRVSSIRKNDSGLLKEIELHMSEKVCSYVWSPSIKIISNLAL